MPVYKDAERNTWYVDLKYKDELSGKFKHHVKRGFKTQKEAKAYERDFMSVGKFDGGLTIGKLCELYLADIAVRLKPTTYHNQSKIVDKHILPYFSTVKANELKVITVRNWQNRLIKAGYKDTYLHTLHMQLSSILNFGMKYLCLFFILYYI